RSVLQGFLVRQAGSGSIVSLRISKFVACRFASRAITAQHLRHGWHIICVQLIQSANIFQDGVQVLDETRALLGGQLEVSEIGDVEDVLFSNHGSASRCWKTSSFWPSALGLLFRIEAL